jgi:ferredoxin
VDAITDEYTDDPNGKWLAVNLKYAQLWPVITAIGDVPIDAAKYENETGKFEKYFSEVPGKGDA